MTVFYYTTTHFLDISIEIINVLKKHVSLHVLIEITPNSKKANIVNVKDLPKDRVMVTPKELMDPADYQHIEPYLDGAASVHFVVHNHDSGLSFKTIRTNFAVKHYIRRFKPDVMHFEFFSLRTAGLVPYLRGIKKVLLAIHDPVPHSGEKNIKTTFPRRIFARLPKRKHFLFYSEFSRKLFEEHNQESDVPRLVMKMRPYSYYSAFGSANPQEHDHILFFGRVSPYKGIDILVESIPEVLKKYPDQKFIIAGRNTGDFQADTSVIEKYKDNIVFLNRYIPNEELASLIRGAKFVVCPYRDATQSGVLMTSYAFDTPVVATAVGAFPEYIEDGVTGELSPRVDAKDFADSMLRALGQYAEMRDYIRAHHAGNTWEVNAAPLIEAYVKP